MSSNILDRGKLRVGILRGGPSPEYEVSLKTGAQILKNIPERLSPVDIFISRDGQWHIDGKERPINKILSQVDVAWNALHGSYGEDGKVQRILESFGVPFTGSLSLPSAMGMNKNISKALFQYHGFKTPEYFVLYPSDNTLSSLVEAFQSIPQPSVVKPMSSGSSLSVKIAKTFESFKKSIENVFKHGGAAVVEEYISGIEVTCAVLEGSDGKTFFSLFPVSPGKPSGEVFDFDLKNELLVQHLCPAPLSAELKQEVQELALKVHKELGLRHYSTIDMIVHPTRGVYVLEVDTLPVLTPSSVFTTALRTADITMEDFIDHVITLALNNK